MGRRSVRLELSDRAAHQHTRQVEGHVGSRLSDTTTRSPIDGTLRELHQVTGQAHGLHCHHITSLFPDHKYQVQSLCDLLPCRSGDVKIVIIDGHVMASYQSVSNIS